MDGLDAELIGYLDEWRAAKAKVYNAAQKRVDIAKMHEIEAHKLRALAHLAIDELNENVPIPQDR